ncbi:MAG: hypothetical protein M3A44_09070 [Gammaproteobacteria bacterium]
MKKAVIFAPFWRQAGHVGNNRVDRFVRWLVEDGYYIVMVRAGSVDAIRQEIWGEEITVHDRLGLYRDMEPGTTTVSLRKPNKLRRALAYWLFNPDPTVVWAKAAARHPAVLRAIEGANFILSSSPPESAHVGAWLLSRRTGTPHIVDMRDGWLDEPLKPLLRSSAIRRWLEGRMEARILRDAKAIQVTSDVWKELLCKRYPALAHKVQVLTNGYPKNMPELPLRQPKGPEEELVLIHAGRFIGSRLTQLPDLLLEPLLQNLSTQPAKGVIRLIGSLSDDEMKIIEPFRLRFQEIGWRIECLGSMPRHELLQLLPQADGLLLLSASYAAIPSKLFEYIPTGKSILVVTERRSATWRVCEKLPQAFLVDIDNDGATSVAIDFFNGIKSPSIIGRRPEEFSEAYLSGLMHRISSGLWVSNKGGDQ